MQSIPQFDDPQHYSTSIRAEDGKQPGEWYGLYEGVLLPLGSLFAVLLCMLAVMLLTHN